MNWQLLDNAVADALCPVFQTLVPATSTIAVVSPFLGPKGMAASMVAASVANLSMLGAAATCSEVQAGENPYEPPGTCQEVTNRGQLLYRNLVTGNGGPGDFQAVKKIIRTYPDPDGPQANGVTFSICEYQLTSGEIRTNGAASNHADTVWWLDPWEGSSCVEEQPEQPLTNPPVPDHTYTDPVTNCNYTVKFEGFIRETPDGPIQPVFQISSQDQLRNNGGRMGGCNLSPVIHVSPPNGPGGPGGPRIPPIPVPPFPPGPGGDGVPWWAGPLLAGATGAALNLIGQEIAKLTEPVYEEGTFTLTAPCDFTEEGDNVSYFFPFPKGNFQQRVIDHQMAILETLQYHLNSKTPTCTSEKPPLEGEWVTTRWISEEKMPHSNHRLRKQFRYRSKSGLSLPQRSAYWEFFQWESGDFIVKHEGAWWGNPQVWAASEEEGKRVIRFAAGEAGLDPDQIGEWKVSRSSSPRYGMSGTMKIQYYKGFPWISSRGGASYPNTLALNHDP